MHNFRHTFVVAMCNAGHDVKVVAKAIGDRAETVLATYRQLQPEKDRLALVTSAEERVAEVRSGALTAF